MAKPLRPLSSITPTKAIFLLLDLLIVFLHQFSQPSSALKLLNVVGHLFLFIVRLFKSPNPTVAFSTWLKTTKHYLYLIGIYFSCTLCLFIVWLLTRFNGCCNDYYLLLAHEVVVVTLVICTAQPSSSESLAESNILAQYFEYIFEAEIDGSISQRDEIKRDCSHLTSDVQRPIKRPRRSVAGVDGEYKATVVENDEIPITESDNASVSYRDLSTDSPQRHDWSDMQNDLLREFVIKLHTLHDFASFSSVCRSWGFACLNVNWSLYPPHPWSVHFPDKNILNLLDDGKYVLERWEVHGRYYYSCVRGWILSIGSQHIHLFNLFSRTRAKFPMLSRASYLQTSNPNDWYKYIEKFILFKDCKGDDHQFLAVALFGARDFVGFTRTSYQDWAIVKNRGIEIFRDALLFQERLFVLCDRGKLVHSSFERSHGSVSLLSQEPPGIPRADRYYLTKNANHMIGVFQYGNVNSEGRRFNTTRFRIYKFKAGDWTQISQPHFLEGRALFIDNGNSWTFDSQEVQNCRTNSIYFTDEYWITSNENGQYTGVYDIAEGDFEEFQVHCPPNNSTPFFLTFTGGT